MNWLLILYWQYFELQWFLNYLLWREDMRNILDFFYLLKCVYLYSIALLDCTLAYIMPPNHCSLFGEFSTKCQNSKSSEFFGKQNAFGQYLIFQWKLHFVTKRNHLIIQPVAIRRKPFFLPVGRQNKPRLISRSIVI